MNPFVSPFGFDRSFGIVGILFTVMFLVILAAFVFVFIYIIREWSKNNHSPRLTVKATVIAKRPYLHNDMTTYYVTFQVESGDRMELTVPNGEYGMMIEGDEGKLTFQGTRYLGFERNV